MSSIERAMDKILDGDAPGVAAAEPVTAQVVEPEPASTAVATSAEPVPSVAANVPPPAVEMPVAPAAQPIAAAASTARPLSANPPPDRIVHLDFARLAAAGFLTPNQATTRQSEEYQQIKRRLLNNMANGVQAEARAPNLILITSSVPSEGKTFTSVNLAISIAMEVDHTVLLIDTDIMKRDTSRVLGVSDRKGLFDLLANPELRLEDLLVRTSMRNLVLLPVGTPRDGSTELLASMRMRELTREIATRYHDRVVLFDSPPVLATTTAAALAPLVGQLILVAEAGSTKQETIRETLQRLDRTTITGVILNKAKQVAATSYDYYGYYQSR
jgi:protein-tyrosine kinase